LVAVRPAELELVRPQDVGTGVERWVRACVAFLSPPPGQRATLAAPTPDGGRRTAVLWLSQSAL